VLCGAAVCADAESDGISAIAAKPHNKVFIDMISASCSMRSRDAISVSAKNVERRRFCEMMCSSVLVDEISICQLSFPATIDAVCH
jgi:hypothetical protein